MSYQILPSNSRQLLSDLVKAENPTQELCDQLQNRQGKERSELREVIKELCDNGYISVSWASNNPYIVTITNAGRTYEEQMERDENLTPEQEKLNDIIALGERALKEDFHKNSYRSGVIAPDMVSGDVYDSWMNQTKIFCDRHLRQHPLYDDIVRISSRKDHLHGSATSVLNSLKSVRDDTEFWSEYKLKRTETLDTHGEQRLSGNKVFIVHGHDDAAKYEVARALEHAGFEAIILHEQANAGKTIIEKIESYTDVSYAVVLYTPCDRGMDARDANNNLKPRARQNVVFEHGYLIGKLGRDHVAALVKGDIEKPGDIDGVIYIPMDSSGGWKLSLAKEMKAAGLDIDLNQWV